MSEKASAGLSPAEARAQAAECIGFLAPVKIVGKSGKAYEIAPRVLWDADQLTRADQLEFEMESWDRHPDVLNEDGTVKVSGELKEPYRKDGKLVENYRIQEARAYFGDDYDSFIADGGRVSDVNLILWQFNKMISDREKDDSKSNSGDAAVESVPQADQD